MRSLLILLLCMIISAICYKPLVQTAKPPLTDKPQPVRTSIQPIIDQGDENEAIDYTDPKLKQVMTEMTGYPNMDDLMAVVFQEYLKANNMSVIERPEEKRFGIKYFCCRRKKIWRWWVCVKWCFVVGFGKK